MSVRPFVLFMLVCSTMTAFGQPEPAFERKHGHPRMDRERGDRPRVQPVIERWLLDLEQKDPEEHQRLLLLREEDPEAFRGEVRRHYAQARGRPSARQGDGPRIPEVAGQVKAYQEAKTDAERDRIRESIRAELAGHLDRRLAFREQRIQSIREELERLEDRHETDKARRDSWIDEALEQLLQK